MSAPLLSTAAVVAHLDLGEAAVVGIPLRSGALLGCADGAVLAVDGAGRLVRRGRPTHRVRSLCLLPIGRAVGGDDGLHLVSRGTTETLLTSSPVLAVARGAEEMVFAAGCEVRTPTGVRIDAGIGTVLAMAPLRGGRLLAAAGTSGLAWVDVGAGAVEGRIDLATLLTVVASPDGEWVAAGSLDGAVHVLRAWAGDGAELEGYPDRVRLVSWLRQDGQQAVAAVADDEITVWRMWGGRCATSPVCLHGHDTPITALAVSADGGLLASGDDRGVIRIWRPLLVDEPLVEFPLDAPVTTLCWAADRAALVACDQGGGCTVLSVSPGLVA